MILSISLILLVSLSFVSASWFGNLFNGDVIKQGQDSGVRPARQSEGDSLRGLFANLKPVDRTSSRISLAPQSRSTYCPTGWTPISYLLNGKKNECCMKR